MASEITNVWEVLGHETKWKARLSCGHEVRLTMKEQPKLGQKAPCPTCQPVMAAEWYQRGLKRVAREIDYHCTEDDAHSFPKSNCIISGECSALADEVVEVLTRELGPLLAALGMIPNDVMFNHLTREQMVSFRAAKQAFLEGSDGKG